MSISDIHKILTDRFNKLMKDRFSIVFLRKSDNTFLGTDVLVEGFLKDPDLYYIEDDPKLYEIILGLFKGNYKLINDSINAIVYVG
jgi:hypothetical protein